nr:MAG TPA: hypothetical protein [Caudoviricetes sp.]
MRCCHMDVTVASRDSAPWTSYIIGPPLSAHPCYSDTYLNFS